MKYVIRPAARAELTDIWLYTANRWGVDQADEYVAAIVRRIENAAELPEIGTPISSIPSSYREIAAGTHRIVYRMSDRELTVVRILHVRQDIPDDLGH